MSITISSDIRDDEGLNFSNSNAYSILHELGLIETDSDLWDCVHMPINLLLVRCQEALNRPKIHGSNLRQAQTTTGEKGCKLIESGFNSDDMIERIMLIEEWAKQMQEAGACEIMWG